MSKGVDKVAGLAIEGWSPEYGAPVETGAEDVPADQVDAEAEVPEGKWAPLDAGPDAWAPGCADFVDGVRRIEARMWITDAEGEVRLGVCASYAAGLVRCAARAEIAATLVERGFFGLAGVPDLATPAGRFRARPVAEDDIQQLVNGLQERMGRLEVEVAAAASPAASQPGPPSNTHDSSLIVLDGPLRGRQPIPGAIGYVKSHRVQYLPAALRAVVGRLKPGQRTPLFLIQTKWTRFSWYLRLSPVAGHPWAGIARCEAWADGGLERTRRLADATAVLLPRFASEPHKDDRAPQNLYPIAGLERELRRRLGDPGLVYRGLQRAVAAWRG